jgi:hypothetical protein
VDANNLYCQHYGYRSGLNNTMINHLNELVQDIESKINLKDNDIILDIGSNDCTLLKAYTHPHLKRVGIDPTSEQFKQYYPTDVVRLPTFFNQDVFKQQFGDAKAKVVTTISMFYDLNDPLTFTQDIKEILDQDGLWIAEQAYTPTMLENNNFDTILHEHLLYLCLKQFQYICQQVGFKIIDVIQNDCNGCSFRLTMAHQSSDYFVSPRVQEMTLQENLLALHTLTPLNNFIQRCEQQKDILLNFLNQKHDKKILLLGSSTKGNTLVQYYGLDHTKIIAASERNPEKWGRMTPKTHIPIISEEEARALKPDYFLVLPWHFKKELLMREQEFLNQGGQIIFPLPHVEIYNQHGLVHYPMLKFTTNMV